MSTLSKVTLGIVFIMALFFWYMAMRTLKTHEAWRDAANKMEDAVEAAETEIDEIVEEDPDTGKMSLGQLQVALDSAVYGRGRVWTNTNPRFDANAGTVQVFIEQPQPHQVEPNMVVHAFQGLENAGTGLYVGEFKVTAADANSVTLTPIYTPSAVRLAVLQQAVGPWSLYEVLPDDTNALFSGLTEQEIQALLPPPPRQFQGESNDDFQARQIEHNNLVLEYTQDNKPIDPDNPPPPERISVIVKFIKEQAELSEAAKNDLRAIDFGENLVKAGTVMKVDLETAEELVRLGLVQEVERRYQRQLRDYLFILREFHRKLPIIEDHIVNLEKDLEYMIEANKEADAQLVDARKQEATLKQELALVSKERDVISQHQGTLQERLDRLNAGIARLQEENQRLAAQLVQRQLEAVQGGSRSASATALASPR
jgi:hypothetical protein